MIDHVLETGDEGKGDLSRLSYSHLLIDPIFKPKASSVAFQAADLIAYEHYKANLKVLDLIDEGVVDEFRIPFKLLAGIPGSADWGILDKEHIEIYCQRNRVPLR